MQRCVTLLAMVLALFATASATTYIVTPDGNGDFPTIQAAIDAAGNGDVIELTDGTFRGAGNRDIDFLGKAVTLRSQSGDPAACVLDCEGTWDEPHRCFYFLNEEDASTVIQGITIANAHSPTH